MDKEEQKLSQFLDNHPDRMAYIVWTKDGLQNIEVRKVRVGSVNGSVEISYNKSISFCQWDEIHDTHDNALDYARQLIRPVIDRLKIKAEEVNNECLKFQGILETLQ